MLCGKSVDSRGWSTRGQKRLWNILAMKTLHIRLPSPARSFGAMQLYMLLLALIYASVAKALPDEEGTFTVTGVDGDDERHICTALYDGIKHQCGGDLNIVVRRTGNVTTLSGPEVCIGAGTEIPAWYDQASKSIGVTATQENVKISLKVMNVDDQYLSVGVEVKSNEPVSCRFTADVVKGSVLSIEAMTDIPDDGAGRREGIPGWGIALIVLAVIGGAAIGGYVYAQRRKRAQQMRWEPLLAAEDI